MANYPQIVTEIGDFGVDITTQVEAPWVSVTSVNGMTGDVTVDSQVNEFEANHFYKQNSMVLYQGQLYYAKQDFTSGVSFNANDWNTADFAQEQADWTESDNTKKSYIKNKPTLAEVATSGEYSDLEGTPTLAEVATSGDYEDLENAPELAEVATSGSYTDLVNVPTVVSSFTNDVNYLRGVDGVDVESIATDVSGARLINGTVTRDKLDLGMVGTLSHSTSTTSVADGSTITWHKRELLGGITEYFGWSESTLTMGAGDWGSWPASLPDGISFDPTRMTFFGAGGAHDGAIIVNVAPPETNGSTLKFSRQNKYADGSVTTRCCYTVVLRVYEEES